MRFWSSLPHVEPGQTERWVARTIAATRAGEADEFVVEHRGRAVGKVGLWRGDELGLLIFKEAWGQGFAVEAARAVIERGFARGLPRITAEADPDNHRSLRALAKLGFRVTGTAERTLLLGDRWYDSVYLERRRAAGPPP